ncbi:MAG TPA: Glu-tRNA(Gln) amidotransferase GatDE subunit E, partial [archaeon]|nr:Glu-tRNA(Gln) amidotransferase GatDE subunit E [archaeon]
MLESPAAKALESPTTSGRHALTCGLEIHQQLATKKLFCPCASSLAQEKPIAVIRRQLRAVAGELGAVDVAAAAAAAKGSTFAYHAFAGESCEVELDEEPPQELNPEALDLALQLALLLKCWIPPEVHVMRKTVLDGSNTTGFQRTAVIGLNGTLETSKGAVSIPTVCLEEESCQILKKRSDTIDYGLNRLGIPLIEIATSPDIHDPEHAREAAEAIGSLLRSTGKVRRGIGTIRQDVNVSIPSGSRVEIKGFQELNQIPIVINKEMERQHALLKEGKAVPKEVRKAKP